MKIETENMTIEFKRYIDLLIKETKLKSLMRFVEKENYVCREDVVAILGIELPEDNENDS